ncbi:MAG: hypothetical protein K8T89_12060 [Planctomycetes bacterium]|nr:hypothetical protein [Planctomycetota bacterium]
MSHRFAVVAEAPADHQTATELADRILIDSVNWLDEDHLPHQREWVVEASGEQFTWKRIPKLARAAGIEAEGFFNGEPGLPDARAARRALRYLRATIPGLEAVVLIRDQDDQTGRRNGLEQARQEDHEGMKIAIGLAIIEREAWVISGFVPQNEAEQTRLDGERQALGFNPCERSHELTAGKNDAAPRSPKRVLRALTANDLDRQRQCWVDTPLVRLRECGASNGLVQFLDEIRTRLAPLIGRVAGEVQDIG